MEKVEVKIKRPRANATHRWSETESRNLIEAVLEEVKGNPENFEKPTAQRFYENVSKKASLSNLSWTVMKCEMRHMKAAFVSSVNWKSQTGAGLLEEGDETSVQEYINKICPNFQLLEQLFGQRKNVVPAVVYTTTSDVIEIAEEVDFTDNVFSDNDSSVSQAATVLQAESDSQILMNNAGPDSLAVH